MGNAIKVSPKYGLNPTIPVCFWCGKERGEIALMGRMGMRGSMRIWKPLDMRLSTLSRAMSVKRKWQRVLRLWRLRQLRMSIAPPQFAAEHILPEGMSWRIRMRLKDGLVTNPLPLVERLFLNPLFSRKCLCREMSVNGTITNLLCRC